MRNIVGVVFDIILYLVIFLLSQVLSTLCLSQVISDKATALTYASGLSSLLTIIIFVATRWARVGTGYVRRRPAALLMWVAILAVALILPSQFLEAKIPTDMPDYLVQMLREMMNHKVGYLVVAIVAPVAEEMVFRGAILRRLLDIGGHRWTAIVMSSIIFGAIHGNLAQFTHAFVMGLLLGWLYVRTSSILPGLVVHWANNTVAYAICMVFEERADAGMDELFSGNMTLMYASIGVSTMVAAVALWQVIRHAGDYGSCG